MNNRLINTKVAGGGGGCTDIVDNYDPFGGNGVALYQLNGDATDVSGNYNGTASNVTWGGAGVFGTSANMKTLQGNIVTPVGVYSNSFSGHSVSFWMYSGGTDYETAIWTRTADIVAAGWGIRVGIGGNSLTWFWQNNANSFVFVTEITGTFTDGWHHIVASWDGTTNTNGAKLYVDGNLSSQLTANATLASQTFSLGLTLGADRQSAGRSILGLDQVRVFNEALTPLEVEALYTEELCICDGTVDTLDILGDGSCVATYQLDGNANDLSGNYSGTPTDVSYGVGEFDLAGVFNGSSSEINLNSAVLPSSVFSVSMWFNLNTINRTNYLITQYILAGGSNGRFEFAVDSTNNFVIYLEGGALTFTTSVSLSANTWYNVVLIKNGASGWACYLDGQSLGTNSDTRNIYTGDNTRLGKRVGLSSGVLDGSLDQVRIFNKALSAGEVTTLYNETACTKAACTGTTNTLDILGDSSCIAAYPLDGSPADLSGNYNGVQTDVTYPQGYFDLAGSFNGSSSQITHSLNAVTNMSVSLWIYLTQTPTNNIVYEFNNGYGLWFINNYGNQGKIGVQYANSNSSHKLSNSTIPLNQWVHIVAIHGSGTASLYVNNVSQNGGNMTDYLTCDQNTIGSRRTGEFFKGQIDQVRIFNKALNSTEVGILYNNETPCN